MSLPIEQLVTIATRTSAFEAEAIVAALRAQDIESLAVHSENLGAAMPIPQHNLALVVVHRDDEQKALEAIESIRAESGSIDWDAVDVGTRQDDLPLRRPGRMPLPAKIGFIVAILMLLLTAALVVLMAVM